jgi:predicted AAA+ superfamily ATPase
MNKIKRELTLSDLIKKNSIFLFGPRATGKSTLLKTDLAGRSEHVLQIDLLRLSIDSRLKKTPPNFRN